MGKITTIKTESLDVKLASLRAPTMCGTDDHLYFDQDRYLLRDALALTPDTVRVLLARIQLVVAPSVERKRLFQVVFGSRLFNLAALTLEPDEDIKVLVVRNADKEVIDHLRYLDLAVLPLVLSLDGTIHKFYDLVESSPSLHGLVWRTTSKASFARAIGASRIRDRSKKICSKYKGGGKNDSEKNI